MKNRFEPEIPAPHMIPLFAFRETREDRALVGHRYIYMALGLLFILLGVLLGNVQAAYAQENPLIQVFCGDTTPTQLYNAIRTANDRPGPDVIEISPANANGAPCDIVFSGNGIDYGNGRTALEPITDELTIRGNGAIFRRSEDAGNFRFLETADGVTLRLENVVFRGGRANLKGGAVYAGGSLYVSQVTATLNQADDGAAFYVGGEFHAEDAFLGYNSARKAGGVIYSEGNVTLVNVEAVENQALNHSSVLYGKGDLHARRITVNDNETPLSAGAIFVHGAATILEGSEFNHQTGRALSAEGPIVIENAVFMANESHERAGAILALDSIVISATVFLDNQATSNFSTGGAIYAHGPVTLQGNSEIRNSQARTGGAIYGVGTVNVYDSVIADNRADQGGGIWAEGDLYLIRSSLLNNETLYGGGGAYTERGATVRHALVEGNHATEGAGGGIYAESDSTIEDSIFRLNHAEGGGGFYVIDGVLYVARAQFLQNRATEFHGGGLFALHAEIVDTLFIANATPSGGFGGGALIGHHADVQRSRFERNQAGRGAAVSFLLGEDVYVANNIFAQNRPLTGGAITFGVSGITDHIFGTAHFLHNTLIGNNDIDRAAVEIRSGAVIAQNNILDNHDRGLVVIEGLASSDGNLFHRVATPRVQINEGDSDLIDDPLFADAANGDYSLHRNSPAIDSGIALNLDHDFLGAPRPQGNGLDRGAFEYTPTDAPIDGLAIQYTGPVYAGQPVTFRAEITAGDNVSYAWDLGDGTTAEGAQINHAYAAAGQYTVHVTARNTAKKAAAEVTVTVTAPPVTPAPTPVPEPSPEPEPSPDPNPEPEPTPDPTPNPEPTPAPDPNPEPTPDPEPEPKPSPTPDPLPGEDEQPAPIDGLQIDAPTQAQRGQTVRFSAQVNRGSGVEYTWSFGSGIQRTGPSVEHTFDEVGEHVVQVTAQNPVSRIEQTVTVLIVADPPSGGEETEQTPGLFLPALTR